MASSSRASNRRARSVLTVSRSWISTPASSLRACMIIDGINRYDATAVKPSVMCPASPPEVRRAVAAARAENSSKCRASRKKRLPAALSSTCRLLRSNSVTPRSCSSNWICRDSGGCVMHSRSAARPKCSSSATAMKHSN
ncbi:hypothetical protein G6F35_016473 [Rhizopus arrhizus]|nr:hypothetical protein G6F35_016473 [Rhizopus arrhizus]